MENLRGSLLMVAAMAGFALEDMFIKLLSERLPTGQILVLIGAGGALVFSGLLAARGRPVFTRALLSRNVLLRNAGELAGTICFVTAITLTPLSSASAILQAVPLAVVSGAALFLGEEVGWRRWTAVLLGFAGVLMVVQPGLAGFEPASLFAVAAIAGLAGRDLATRRIPGTIPSMQLSAAGFATIVPAGAIMLAVSGETWVAPDATGWAQLGAALVVGVLAYSAIVGATRVGEMSVIAVFRYARIVFALVIGALVFAERPDALTLAGAALIVGSGLYAIWRENAARRRRRASLAVHTTL